MFFLLFFWMCMHSTDGRKFLIMHTVRVYNYRSQPETLIWLFILTPGFLVFLNSPPPPSSPFDCSFLHFFRAMQYIVFEMQDGTGPGCQLHQGKRRKKNKSNNEKKYVRKGYRRESEGWGKGCVVRPPIPPSPPRWFRLRCWAFGASFGNAESISVIGIGIDMDMLDYACVHACM